MNAGWNLENSYALLPEAFYSRVDPTPVHSPDLVLLNHSLADTLGLNLSYLQSEEGVAVLAGNRVPEGSVPIAQAYAGHQFGHFTMLGDGRALLIGEQIPLRGGRFDIQLKGSGRTPYSRGGDGRAALGPMLREYIISEAMYAMGIPTTRSLAVTLTGEPVFRETVLPGAILTRVAESHIRVGTFQYASRWGTPEDLRALADYTWNRHFAQDRGNVGCDEGADGFDVKGSDGGHYISLLKKVCRRQGALIARWQLVGFIHGVMNTDNVAISGETIDYGPCAFMDAYDPATVFSSIDVYGRYAYGNQPEIGRWNLAKLARALLPLFGDDQEKAVDLAEEALSEYDKEYNTRWLKGMRWKLGIFNEEPQDKDLAEELLEIMKKQGADFTNTFRALTLGEPAEPLILNEKEYIDWRRKWKARLERQPESDEDSRRLMRENNPAIIPRNHRVEEALEAAINRGDFSFTKRLVRVLSNPFAYSPEQEEYAKRPEPSACQYRTFCGT